MSVTTFNSVIAGAGFGAALTAAGVYSPGIILAQLRLEDFHMLKTFLAASATSAIAIILARRWGFTSCKPRLPNSVGLFGPYDGNLIGGTLLGVGLALTGACPGTVIPQVATGIRSGPLVLAGGLLGGIIYSKLGSPLQRKVVDVNALTKPTVHEQLGLSKQNGILLFETLALGAVGVVNIYYPDSPLLLTPAIVGGLLVGLSQGLSLVLTGNTIGISSAYEQLGDVFWWLEKSVLEPTKRESMPNYQKAAAFAVGTGAGSIAVSRLFELPSPATVDISSQRAIVGGAIMIYGSRLAGGCTSGHGISGMSQLSISSFVTIIAMFGAGVALTALLG